ncbi:ABC transporter ATP-binding protein [Acuticoccus mangrovi]|uniref:ABC transporter ATP-binding protein n=1 Tax=Acuticoccus mangrovi TaxID=2796142 RepID=A0A934IS92_9HYPH|nr:ABC transporter ATP-binding protein [Acuticoccus mangrovi]MBJ3776724.1 ABC transporter ATP-binding protein [Acuticoccus mangrovi]
MIEQSQSTPSRGVSLRLTDVDVDYGAGNVMSGFSLAVHPGEFFGLLGPSGCGKSTTLGVIAGFVEPSRGKVLLDERDVTAASPQRRGVGVVFQSYALFPHMTVTENVGYGLRVAGKPADYRQRVASLLELVRLDGKGHRLPRELSGGEQQRVAIARALAVQPELLLLDEPLSNLDARLRADMQAELRRIQREANVTTIFVTHDQEEAFGICDRVAVMNRGRIEQIGNAREIYKRPASRFVARFVGRTNHLTGEGTGDRAILVGGHRIAVPEAVAAGKSYDLFVRPEEVMLAETAGEGNSLPAKVVSIQEAGPHRYYRVETAIGVLEACRSSKADVDFGSDDVYASWLPEASTLLDAPHG